MSAAVVSDALEQDHVESHLHPEPTYDLAAHPAPSGREEIWRFTPLKRLRGLLEDTAPGGRLEQKIELPDGVTLSEIPLEEAVALGGTAPFDRLGALAAKNAGTAWLLDIASEADVVDPVRIQLHGTSVEEAVAGRVVVRIGNHARAVVLIEHSGSTTYNAFTSVLVGDGAQLDLVHINDWADDAVHTEQINVRVGRDATLRQFEFTLGGDLVRTSTNVDYAGPGGSAELFGLYFADAGQHFEHRLFVDHNAPKTKSNVVYKGALQGAKAHTVWIGNVLIRKVAEGIETYEENRNLVLTEGCQADSVPNLEIETGEIEGAGHASAVGRFDDNQLFYLRSRGISEAEARKLVVRGFFDDLIRRVTVPEVAAKLSAQVEEELQRHVLAELDEADRGQA
ncbi:Fe-S cluster assembly protein SufD [Nocardioides sp. Root190]|uniref:Fe-S cluster assembly protein SufD n=1 Tax=Nocardioides sp. Root190 TaxID=1736488 RepID=UPI0006FC7C5C|nr:Fe-S cluster assembly protein SufD [Nocardioides sp. Root190]KRB73964.1 Fe-S cluster assembly protein SufD [Nocardioides sp. Root190]